MDGVEGGGDSSGEKMPAVVDLEDDSTPAMDRETPESFHSSSDTHLVVDEAAGAVGGEPLPPSSGQDSASEEELTDLMARLRMNPILRTRLEENLIEDGRALGNARAQG